MSIATLADIIAKVRRLTGSANTNQLTEPAIIDYINSFYTYDFPAQFRSLQLKNTFSFNTIKGRDTYPFDFEHYSTVEAPAYVNKKIVSLYQSPWPFYSLFFNWLQREVLDTGDGSTGTYSGTVQSAPIIRSVNNNPIVEQVSTNVAVYPSGYPPTFTEPNIARAQNILISAESATTTMHVTDDGAGNLIGDVAAGGAINYTTGAVTGLIFTSAVVSGNEITIAYNPANEAIPQAILFWQNNIVVRPVPDAGYQVEVVAYRLPSQALLGSSNPDDPDTTGLPELKEWWETIAFGASKKVFEDRQDEDGIQQMSRSLQERFDDNETRTYAQLGKQRTSTIYEGQFGGGDSNYNSWGASQ